MAVTEPAKDNAKATERVSPIVLDLGKHKKKVVKRLRNGKGKLLDEAMESIVELQRVGSIPQSAQPVIVVVREKSRSNKMFPFMGR
jgi:hypothetical protein